MSDATEHLQAALQHAMAVRPQVVGFPYLAEVLRRAGVSRNVWQLPSCQSLYLTRHGPVVMQGTPLIDGMVDVPVFDRDALIRALRADQAGESSFAEFLHASWIAGVVGYDVDFDAHTCIYHGAAGETYVETYPTVDIPAPIT